MQLKTFALLVWLITSVAQGQDTTWAQTYATKVDQAIAELMKKKEAVGCAVGVIWEGKVVYSKGYGLADREAKKPVTTDTLFRWASISKTVTAVAAMQLVEQGKLDLNQDVRHYVPEFPDKGTPITVRQLLCHQGGIVHYINGKVIKTLREYDRPNPYADTILALDTFKESPLVNAPGEKYSYSTHAYILLSAVIERAGKQKFADQIKERINKPLGLTTLQPDYQWVELKERTMGYRRVGGAILKSSDTDVSWKLGGGGFISTIDDMANYASGLINRKLCSEASARAMWQAQKTAKGEKTSYGLGFGVEVSPEGRLRISHSGGQEKTRTLMVIFPEEKRGVVFMTNSEHANPGEFVQAVIRAVNAK